MSQATVLDRTHRGRAWLVAMLGILAAAVTGAQAELPDVVYQKVFTQYTPITPEDIAVDDAGNAYILASRWGNNYAARMLKLDPEGNLIWFQEFDGSQADIPGGMALDAAGDVYIAGTTGSPDFPTLNPLQAELSSVQNDAFVMKLSGVDGTLLYSTYFGSTYSDRARDIAVNDEGEMYIVGQTKSPYLPMVDPLQGTLGGDPYYPYEDAFIAKISADGSALLYSTYFGGEHIEDGRGIALDDAGRIHIVGTTRSAELPTVNPAQGALGGGSDAFAARISADGQTLEYCTYLGGESGESVHGMALDSQGRLYIGGGTSSLMFPTTPGAYQEEYVGGILACEIPLGGHYNCPDVYVARLSADGAKVEYATYLGGHQTDECYGLTATPTGQAYVAGHTKSQDFPPYASGTFFQVYLTKLDAAGAVLEYTALFDTTTVSTARVVFDPAGDIYLSSEVHTPTDLQVVKLTEGGAKTGDVDADGDVDLNDFATFAVCFHGSGVTKPPAGCEAGEFSACDMDNDGDVDHADFSTFALEFTGAL